MTAFNRDLASRIAKTGIPLTADMVSPNAEREAELEAKAGRMAEAMSAPPATPEAWDFTREWPMRHKRAGDRRVHATVPFLVNGVQRIWTACEKPVGEGGYPMRHLPVDCRECRKATEEAAS